MRKQAGWMAAAAVAVAMAPRAKADIIFAEYDFTGNSLAPTTTAPGIFGSNLTRDLGEPIAFSTGNPTPGANSPVWNGPNDYFQILLTNNSPDILDITGVSVDMQSPQFGLGGGPSIGTLKDGNGVTLAAAGLSTSFTTLSATGINEMVNPGASIIFRDFAAGASGVSQQLNIDDWKVTGHSIPVSTPEPGSGVLLGGALAALAAAGGLRARHNRRENLELGNQETGRQQKAADQRLNR